jgi:putative transposase
MSERLQILIYEGTEMAVDVRLGEGRKPVLLRSDNNLVVTSRRYTSLVRSYGLKQEFIASHCPQQNGVVERLIRTLKEQCSHRHRFETL